jgi:hypothetical protein
MNSKSRTDDWRVKLAFPIFLLVDFLLKTEIFARRLFNSFRKAENVQSVLKNVYVNKDAVDVELVELICRPGSRPSSWPFAGDGNGAIVPFAKVPQIHASSTVRGERNLVFDGESSSKIAVMPDVRSVPYIWL